MFCTKCGKANKDGARFCAYCGAELHAYQSQDGKSQGKQPGRSVSPASVAGAAAGLKATDYILLVLSGILTLIWTNAFVSNYEATELAFEWLGDDGKQGLLCYLFFFALILGTVIAVIVDIFKRKYHVSLGVTAFVISLIIGVGKQVYDELAFDTWELIWFRVFRVYGEIWILSLVISVLLTVVLYAKYSQNRQEMMQV